MVAALLKLKATTFVIDGELVIPVGKDLSFDALLMRIHPPQGMHLRPVTLNAV